MWALFDREFRKARRAALEMINLYEALRKDKAFDQCIRKVVVKYNSRNESRPFDDDFYYFFFMDIGQCHRILNIPIESGRSSSMAALIFIAHVFDFDATKYANYLKLKNNPDVMKKFFSLFDSVGQAADEIADRITLLAGLSGYDRETALNCALVLNNYGNYLREMESIPSKDYKKFGEILKRNTDIISSSDLTTAIEQEIASGIRKHPSSENKSEDSPVVKYKSRRAANGYYGMSGEFETNDRSRRVSEDIEQFSNAHPDADVAEHYYWDDVLDAETDDYIKANNE